jgi:hypothetical protein
MNRPDSLPTMTLAKVFDQFLDSTPFARRTRESYTDDLAPLLTQHGHAPVSVLTTEIIQAYLCIFLTMRKLKLSMADLA